jgi:hemolysin III
MAESLRLVADYDEAVSAAAPAKPLLRGWFHAVAFFVSVPAGVALVLLAGDASARATAIIYTASLSAVFGASAAYHRGAWSAVGRRRMKRLDHAMIFVLIAGTYTPVCALVLHAPWSVVLLAVVWGGAAAGVVMKVARIDALDVLSGALYIVLGWLAVLALPQLIRELPAPALALMIGGGVLYTGGAVVLARKRPDPAPAVFGYHEVWHAFMVVAAACHYAMILLIVRAAA